MSSSWKYKFYGTIFLIVLSLYTLTPTFVGLKEKREALKKADQKTPWFYSLLPAEELNLGLDLRGGLYLELEVDLATAMRHQAISLASDIQRYVLKDDLSAGVATAIDSRNIRVEIPEGKRQAFDSGFVGSFGNATATIETQGAEIFFAVNGDVEAGRKSALEALKGLQGYQGDVTTTQDKKHLAVIIDKTGRDEEIKGVFAKPELAGMFTLATPANLVYVKLSDTYYEKLRKDVIEQASNAVRNRIDRYGVAEASVSRAMGDRLVVELPGAKNPEDLINVIRRTGKLEFRLVEEKLSRPEIQALVETKSEELKLDKPYEGDKLTKLNAALKADLPEHTEVLFSLERDPASKKIISAEPYLLTKEAEVTGDMLDNAKVETQNNQPYVSMAFNKAGAKKFGDLTSANVGKQLAIVLDSVVMSAPVIRSAITGGQAQIELGIGRFETLLKEAQDLVLILREGALPAGLTVASKNVIGPSLGMDSIESGLKSLWISSLLVVAFMLIYYRAAGVVANLALILNVLLLFAALCLFQASLTLPGLAGIALTIGMAVDANVIIFERMREERFLGHGLKETVESGYANAMSAIIDGNITTFIAGLVLFEFGTGPIKGFATTLMIGILTTMFSAIVFTRLLFDWMTDGLHMKRLSY